MLIKSTCLLRMEGQETMRKIGQIPYFGEQEAQSQCHNWKLCGTRGQRLRHLAGATRNAPVALWWHVFCFPVPRFPAKQKHMLLRRRKWRSGRGLLRGPARRGLRPGPSAASSGTRSLRGERGNAREGQRLSLESGSWRRIKAL